MHSAVAIVSWVVVSCIISATLVRTTRISRGDELDEDQKRNDFIDSKLAIEREVISQFTALVVNGSSSAQGKPKVAFLFLAIRDIALERLWDQFFSAAPKELYSIYVHQAHNDSLNDTKSASLLPLAAWGARPVPWVKSEWCALFGSEVAALVEALKDPQSTQFVFVSDSTIPMKSFDYVYRQLVTNSPTTSKFCLATPATHNSASAQVVQNEWKRSCVFHDYYRHHNPRTLKHHQWIVLAREHAHTVVRRAAQAVDIYEDSWRKAAPDIKNAGEGCSDEAAPLAALLYDLDADGRSTGDTFSDFTRIGIEQQCLTFVTWRYCFFGTPLSLDSHIQDAYAVWNHPRDLLNMISNSTFDFMQSAIKHQLNGFPHNFDTLVPLTYLQTLARESFLFARKFTDSVVVDAGAGRVLALTDVLPQLWHKIDEEAKDHVARAVWKTLEASGRVGALQ